jgi:hypothetical protein
VSLKELNGFPPSPEEVDQHVGIDQHRSEAFEFCANFPEIDVVATAPNATASSEALQTILGTQTLEILIDRLPDHLALVSASGSSNPRHALGFCGRQVNLRACHTL